MRVTLGGAEVDLVGRDEVLAAILSHLTRATARPLFLASANLDHVHHFGLDSGREGAFDAGRGGADWLVLLDGRPVVRAARRVTGVSWEQLAGSDLLPDVLLTAARGRARVGFVGGTEEQHRALATVLADRFPSLEVAGFWGPPRGTFDDPASAAALAEELLEAQVDLLVIGLGKPTQEEWLLAHGAASGVRVAVAFGAASDFLAGTVRRPNLLFRRSGLEWLARLVREPRRLFRRYVIQGPPALYRLWRRSSAGDVAAGLTLRPAALLTTPSHWRTRFGRLLVGMDAISIAAASLLAYLLRQTLGDVGVVQGLANEIPTALAVIPMWLGILAALGCYRPQYLNAGGEAYRRFVTATLVGVLALGFLSFAFDLDLSRGYVLILSSLVLTFGGATRLLFRGHLTRQREHGRFIQNVLVAGADEEAIEVVTALGRAAAAGYRVVGFVDDDLPVGAPVVGTLKVLGRTDDVLDLAYDLRAGLVLVSAAGVRPGTLRELTEALEGSPVDLAVAPSLFHVVTRRVTVESVANVPILHVDQVRLSAGKATAKRTLDLLVATVLGLLLSPLVLGAALAVRLGSPGPVLFRQRRVGREGREFNIIKFRTMQADAEEHLDDVAELNEAGHLFFKVRDDPRVTRVGRFLRKWSIDELPQLWNVLRGDMSLVGPRPPLPAEVEKYEPWHLRRLRVKPGITGVWQVSGRSQVPFDEAVRLDLFYIENWSLGYDLFLLGKTVLAVLGRHGAW